MDVEEPTATVVLNAADLGIDEAVVVAGDTRHAARLELDESTERLHLHLDEPLAVGGAVVELAFTGVLNDKLKGFYRSTFTDEGGHERVLATTQFEATDARRAFPCWDEPEFKATFAVTLEVPDDLLAVSNAREVARQPLEDGWVTGPLRRDHGHVDLPGRLRRRSPRGDRPGRRRRGRPPRSSTPWARAT